MKETIFFPCIIATIWPFFLWCGQRYADRSDDPLGILALLALGISLFVRLRTKNVSQDAAQEPSSGTTKIVSKASHKFDISILVVLSVYIVSIPFASKLVQASIALTLLGLTMGNSVRLGRLVLGDWILLYLTLPIVASLNFYLGYPLRALITQLAAGMLRFEGFQVSGQGTMLIWNAQFVEVDAPCSGLKMLWLSIFMAGAFSSFYRFNARRTMILMTTSIVGAVVANLLRVESLFFLENRIIDGTNWHELMHQGIGVSVFVLLLAVVFLAAHKLAAEQSLQPLQQKATCAVFSGHPALLITLSAAAMMLPLTRCTVDDATDTALFSGWPTEFERRQILPLSEDDTLREFSRGFPGKIGIFFDGQRTICLRWIAHETRQLHAASDCYKGLGYKVTFAPSTKDAAGNRWSCITAERGEKQLNIRERIFDAQGNSWNDVSAWYWSALLQKTRPPWWSITVISH